MSRNTDTYSQQTVSETLKAFDVIAENGLSKTEAIQRIERIISRSALE